MSKKVNGSTVENLSVNYGFGYVVSEGIQDQLVGRIFGIIELAGLTEKQEESAKGLIRKAVWDSFEDAIFISSERHTDIRNIYWERKKLVNENCEPMPAI